MKIPTCSACGKPRPFGIFIKRQPNGTITARINPVFRLVLVESALLEDIYQRIEAVLGASIREAIFEAERAAASAALDNLLPRWLIRRVLRNRLVLHPASRFLQVLARAAGMADAHTVFYHVYRGSMARVRNEFSRELFAAMAVTVENPYSTYLLAGELLAIYEAVEGHAGTLDIFDEVQRVRLSITA